LGEEARSARVAGHRAGRKPSANAQAAVENGVEVLTLYAFSSENWRRTEEEVSDLKGLLGYYLERELDSLAKEGVRLRLIGDYRAFGPDLSATLERAMERLKRNPAHAGGRAELRITREDRRGGRNLA
jgi:undecaprenyl diphosphate synthase